MLAPGGDGIGLVEPHRLSDGAPEPLDVGLAEDRARPAFVGIGDDRPVAEPVGQLEGLLGEGVHAGLADARAVEIGEQLRLGVAGDRAERSADLAQLAQPLDEPRRRVVEQVLAGQFDVRASHVLVGVEHVDVFRSGVVRLARDRAGERRMLDQRVDPEDLARLKVEPDLNDKARIALETLVGSGHGGEL